MNKIILALGLLFPAAGFTQNYSIDWYKVSGGGGTISGGSYTLTSTIGQHDAVAPMTVNGYGSSSYSLTGGFLAIYAVQTPGAPLLRIFLTTTNTAVVAWPTSSTSWSLKSNTNLATTNWIGVANPVNVVGSENQVIISPPMGNKYFRLSNP